MSLSAAELEEDFEKDGRPSVSDDATQTYKNRPASVEVKTLAYQKALAAPAGQIASAPFWYSAS
jgi:hypothetical protein